MSYLSHYLQVTLLEINYNGKQFFKDLVISWPLTRTQIKTLLNIRGHRISKLLAGGQILVFRFGLHLLSIVVSVHLGVLSL